MLSSQAFDWKETSNQGSKQSRTSPQESKVHGIVCTLRGRIRFAWILVFLRLFPRSRQRCFTWFCLHKETRKISWYIKEQCNQKERKTISSWTACQSFLFFGYFVRDSRRETFCERFEERSHLLTFSAHLPFNLVRPSLYNQLDIQEAPKQTLYTHTLLSSCWHAYFLWSKRAIKEEKKKSRKEESKGESHEGAGKIEPNQDRLCCLTRLSWPETDQTRQLLSLPDTKSMFPRDSRQVESIEEVYRRRHSKHTCMDVSVLFHVTLLMESFATILTWVWPSVRVDQEVGRECRWPFEGLPALLALKGLLCRMNGSMLTQTDFMTKSFVAQFAGKGSLSWMRSPSMDFQAMRGTEHLVTLYAGKDKAIGSWSCLTMGCCQRRMPQERVWWESRMSRKRR